jgi:hypothetical protein
VRPHFDRENLRGLRQSAKSSRNSDSTASTRSFFRQSLKRRQSKVQTRLSPSNH